MNINTILNSKQQVVHIATLVVDWCITHLGQGKKKHLPFILFTGRCNTIFESNGQTGVYDPDENDIHIAYNNKPPISELIKTIIHEWTHFTQPVKLLQQARGQPYHLRECEIAAFGAENKYYKQCFNSIKDKIDLKIIYDKQTTRRRAARIIGSANTRGISIAEANSSDESRRTNVGS